MLNINGGNGKAYIHDSTEFGKGKKPLSALEYLLTRMSQNGTHGTRYIHIK
jgi:hypothetical protein